MKDDVQAVPDRDAPVRLVAAENVLRVVGQILPVGGEGDLRDGARLQPAQGGVQEPQVHQQLVPGETKHVGGEFFKLLVLFLCHRGLNTFLPPAETQKGPQDCRFAIPRSLSVYSVFIITLFQQNS